MCREGEAFAKKGMKVSAHLWAEQGKNGPDDVRGLEKIPPGLPVWFQRVTQIRGPILLPMPVTGLKKNVSCSKIQL